MIDGKLIAVQCSQKSFIPIVVAMENDKIKALLNVHMSGKLVVFPQNDTESREAPFNF